jgi:hypothetical protein
MEVATAHFKAVFQLLSAGIEDNHESSQSGN